MLIRVRGGEAGIKEYLENGQKQGRDFDRDTLDERVILAGDLELTDSVINGMDKQGEKYLHITLAFREDEISREVLQNITDEFKEFAYSAYQDDEFNFYAEAHLPKIKSYNHRGTGEFIERKPHVHIVMPEQNLLNGQNLNPLGKVEQQTKFLEAFQEHINAKYGLASPKDHERIVITSESEIISRYKGDVFKGQGSELKAELLDAVLKGNVNDWQQFKEMLAEYGEVKERRSGEYLNLKPEGAKRGTNLKDRMFSREFIEQTTDEKLKRIEDYRKSLESAERYSTPGRPKPTPEQITERLTEWHDIRAKEVRFVNSGNRKLYAEFKTADQERRREILTERAQQFNAKWRTVEHERTGQHREAFTDLENDLRTAGRYVESASRVAGSAEQRARGIIDRGSSRAVRAVVSRLVRDQTAPERKREQQPDRATRRESDSVAGQFRRDLTEQRQQQTGQQGEMVQIKKDLDAARLLAATSQSHGVIPERYEITKGKDGGDRIKCGTRNLNVSDFLTKELNLPWPQAAELLRSTYAEQQAQEPQQQRRATPRAELWAEYREQWKPAQREAKSQAWEQQKASDKQRRGELRQKWYTQKNRIEGDKGLTRPQRRASLSVARMEKALADKALGDQIKQERDTLKEQFNKPAAEQFRDFLTEKAVQGDEAALLELRRQADRPSQAEPGTPTVKGEDQQQEQAAPIMRRLSYQVDRRGDVHYSDDRGRRLFTDAGREVRTYQTKPQELETALRLAVQKFGPTLNVNGTDEYKKSVLDVVAKSGMRVKFADPALEQQRQQREASTQRVKQFDQVRTQAADKAAQEREKQRQQEREVQQAEKEREQRRSRSRGRDDGHGL
ncbi:LPD7 domain-containing protein [Halomonas hibernica]|uniref:LPD7 domain-containing protein n=1 Tax=Halomonas hibernica TaxID=2591147 RepID=UPI0015578884|nr:LPD7 domain-containing protein [Halomonas hibernica]